MSNLRTGKYGQYYGSYYDGSKSLTTSQMRVNATYIFSYLKDKGWSTNAIAGLLGNMQHESAINPGRWQSNKVGAMSGGYGLVQWTPASKYINWCTSMGKSDPSEMDNNLDRLIYELENGKQYYKTSAYPLTFKQFVKSEESPYYLACAFAWNYERSHTVLYGSDSAKESLRQKRGGSANTWYEYLTGVTPTPPGDGEDDSENNEPNDRPPYIGGQSKKMSLLLLVAASKRRVM